MSARNRKHRPDPHGRCYTPPALAEAIVRRVIIGTETTVLEPSAGTGAFVRAVRQQLPLSQITAIEPFSDPVAIENAGADCVLRLPLEATTLAVTYDLVVGNPPYSAAESHVNLLLPKCRRLVFLLRISWAASRTDWLQTTPLSKVIMLTPRPSFERVVLDDTGAEQTIKGGNDATDYAVFVWDHARHTGTTALEFLRWRKTRGNKRG